MNIYDLTPLELSDWLKERGQPRFRAEQVVRWLYDSKISSWDEMRNIPKATRALMAEHFCLDGLKLKGTSASSDGQTTKLLWKLHDGKLVESVIIASGDRRTLCVSSQVGCAARCAFCASGKKGLFRNLSTGEILQQAVVAAKMLEDEDSRLSHIVFMGMGEPFDNYDNVLRTIRMLNAPEGLGISQRRITVSTVGVIEGIHRMAEEGLSVNLVLSLHAPNQHLRKKLIPYARKYDLQDIIDGMENYARATHRDITYEYILIDNFNSGPKEALELGALLRGKQCSVNLIPYNPVAGLKLERPERSTINAFRDSLDRQGIINTCRYTKGDDIAAACGQLALQEAESEASSNAMTLSISETTVPTSVL